MQRSSADAASKPEMLLDSSLRRSATFCGAALAFGLEAEAEAEAEAAAAATFSLNFEAPPPPSRSDEDGVVELVPRGLFAAEAPPSSLELRFLPRALSRSR